MIVVCHNKLDVSTLQPFSNIWALRSQLILGFDTTNTKALNNIKTSLRYYKIVEKIPQQNFKGSYVSSS
jgi:hypothetical protein